MKRYCLFLFIFISQFIWSVNNLYKNLNNDEILKLKNNIEGVWDSRGFTKTGNTMTKFSWGYSQSNINGSIFFDLGNYEFYDSCFSYKILKIEKINDKNFKMLVHYPDKDLSEELIIYLVKDNIIKLSGFKGCGVQ